MMIKRTAEISECGQYRWWLQRRWEAPLNQPHRCVCFVMLNPSKADALIDDPTVRKCIGFAQRWGYNILSIRNMYCLRTPSPDVLFRHDDPVGGRRCYDELRAASTADLVVAAWGVRPPPQHVGVVRQIFADVPIYCVAKTKGGAPKHPLYAAYTDAPLPYWNAHAA